MVTLRAVLESTFAEAHSQEFPNIPVMLNRQVIWDYKDLNGELRLIPGEGVPPSISAEDSVSVQELMDIKEFLDLPIFSESTGEEVTQVEVLKYGKAPNIRYRLNFSTNV